MNRFKIKMILLAFLLCTFVSMMVSQPVTQPWWVVDNGGGKATGGSMIHSASVGQPMTASMSGGNFTLSAGYQPAVLQLNGTISTTEVTVNEKWNMVSVPVRKKDMRKLSLFPNASSQAFAYSDGYLQKDTFVVGKGYWLKFPALETLTLTGTGVFAETIDVRDGWNMIGCITTDVPISGVQTIGTTIMSSYFGYSSAGYISTTTLEPGQGYWVKAGSSGKLVLRSGSILDVAVPSSLTQKGGEVMRFGISATVLEPELYKLTVRDARGRERILYFSSTNMDVDASQYELPPLPPSEIFDVRYTNQQSAAILDRTKNQQIFTVALQAAEYPVTISWDNAENAELLIDNTSTEMSVKGVKEITNPESKIRIRISSNNLPELPKEFAVHQNYPNPFNPATEIRYQLPVKSMVTLKIYNSVGQEVTTLVDDIQDAGYVLKKWNASEVASGLYFYRFEATAVSDLSKSFHEVRKMLLLR
jgi:hypothetical protein